MLLLPSTCTCTPTLYKIAIIGFIKKALFEESLQVHNSGRLPQKKNVPLKGRGVRDSLVPRHSPTHLGVRLGERRIVWCGSHDSSHILKLPAGFPFISLHGNIMLAM